MNNIILSRQVADQLRTLIGSANVEDAKSAIEILSLAMAAGVSGKAEKHLCFRCPDCGNSWEDYQESVENDNCPTCSATEIAPHSVRDFAEEGPFCGAGCGIII